MTARAHRTTLTDAAADELRDHINELTRPRSHREHLVRPVAAGGTRTVFTKVPPLLAQLRWGDWTKGTERGGSGYESRPAASLEALDTLVMIDLEAARWVRDLGEDDPATTIGCVKLLGGLVASANRCEGRRPHEHDGRCHGTARGWCCTWHNVAHDVNRWWAMARISTGWDAPAWRPDNTCPNCGVRRSLRIRLAERVGFCVECRETWGPESYQALAAHVRQESEADAFARRAVREGPCLCRWPRPRPPAGVVGLAALCPRCGSASCAHAVRSTGRKAT